MKRFVISVLSIVFLNSVFCQSYLYDSLGRLAEVIYPNNQHLNFSYDANGNRINSNISTSICPGSQAIFFAGTNNIGSTYQWQVDKGSGFVAITNDINHTGTSTPYLSITGPRSSWYGYIYRCKIDGTNGTTYSNPSPLKFSSTWLGVKDTAWEEPANWTCGKVPDANTDVIINGNTQYLPVISYPASCKSLFLGQGTILNLKGNQLLAIGKKDAMTDIDGNQYSVISICNQDWSAKNLEVTHYRNGDTIPQVDDPATWSNLTTGAWCYYQNNSANGVVYGKLYNWYAINDSRGLAPQGWHIPSDAEWENLADTCLSGAATAGGKIKSTGTVATATGLWLGNFNNSTNSSNFSGLPGGSRLPNGTFTNLGNAALWWSSTQASTTNAFYREADKEMDALSGGSYIKKLGISVRCVKD